MTWKNKKGRKETADRGISTVSEEQKLYDVEKQKTRRVFCVFCLLV